MIGWRLLRLLALGYLLLDLLHFADHIRQGRVLAPQIYTAGTLGLAGSVIVAVLVLRRHPLAAGAATAYGFVAALGVFAAHILPSWGFLSDSYRPLNLDFLSWASAWSLVIAGLALGLVGLLLLLRLDRPVGRLSSS